MASGKNSAGRLNKSSIITLATGILCGIGFAYVVVNVDINIPTSPQKAFINFFQQFGLDSNVDKLLQPNDAEEEFQSDQVDALELANEVKVLCWVMTQPENHQKKAAHIKGTWGPRCNKLLFVSSKVDPKLPSVAVQGITESKDYLWAKTKVAFKLVYEKYFDEVDWFLKADDDTYVIVENLRLLLREYDTNMPIYFGCKFKVNDTNSYMSGGAGYVLSKEALKRFIEVGISNSTNCREDHGGSEDIEMGKCLQNIGVTAGDSRDELGRERFFPLVPEQHVITDNTSSEYWNNIFYPQNKGMEGCSDSAISFHHINPNQMYVLDYLIYHLRPGVNSNFHDVFKNPPSNFSTSTHQPLK